MARTVTQVDPADLLDPADVADLRRTASLVALGHNQATLTTHQPLLASIVGQSTPVAVISLQLTDGGPQLFIAFNDGTVMQLVPVWAGDGPRLVHGTRKALQAGRPVRLAAIGPTVGGHVAVAFATAEQLWTLTAATIHINPAS